MTEHPDRLPPEQYYPNIPNGGHVHITAYGAETLGYEVDQSVTPWVAYLGDRDGPVRWFTIDTPGWTV